MSSVSRSSGPRSRRRPHWDRLTQPASRSVSGTRSRTYGRIGSRTSAGIPPWMRAREKRSTASGRRPSPAPSTGSKDSRTRLRPFLTATEAGMQTVETEVLVIGGGATGAGVLRDAAMRGFRAVLVDRSDLAMGTTGRFHGLLHSGARYAVKDPRSAAECMDENRILKRIAADCIEDIGGFFVSTPLDDPDYPDRFRRGFEAAGIPIEEISTAAALAHEPRLNPHIRRAFTVPDAAIDAWKTVWACVRSAQDYGARVFPYHRVVGLNVEQGAVVGATAIDVRHEEEIVFEARFTVNAGGAWAAELAAMAGCTGITILPGKGIMIAMNHRLVNTVRIGTRMSPSVGIWHRLTTVFTKRWFIAIMIPLPGRIVMPVQPAIAASSAAQAPPALTVKRASKTISSSLRTSIAVAPTTEPCSTLSPTTRW